MTWLRSAACWAFLTSFPLPAPLVCPVRDFISARRLVKPIAQVAVCCYYFRAGLGVARPRSPSTSSTALPGMSPSLEGVIHHDSDRRSPTLARSPATSRTSSNASPTSTTPTRSGDAGSPTARYVPPRTGSCGRGDDGARIPWCDQPNGRRGGTGANGHGRHLVHGQVSGAHLNPAVSIAFALRRDFPWHRVPGYIVVQLIGATLAALFLRAVVNVSAMYGSNYPAHGYSDMAAFWMELILTMGLVSVILGTASGAQNIGLFGAVGVGGYIALAGLWGSPISGASMNPARTFGPDLVGRTFTGYWVYIAGPIAGAVLAVIIAFVLRGPGGGKSGSGAAQGDISPRPMRRENPDRPQTLEDTPFA